MARAECASCGVDYIAHGPNTPTASFRCSQVGIATEKVVNIDKLSELAAAELFVASAPREVRTVWYPSFLCVTAIAPNAQPLVSRW